MAAPALRVPCRFARLVDRIVLIRVGAPAPVPPCADQATHRIRIDLPEPGVLVSLTADVCVWHAEDVRQGGYGLVFPAVPIPGVDLDARRRHADLDTTHGYLAT